MVARFRILALSHSARMDGAEQVFLETTRGLHRRGHTIHAVLPGRGPLATALETAGVAVAFAPLPWWILPPGELDAGHFLAQLGPQVAALRERMQALQTDLVVSSTSVILHGALAAALEKRPHLWQVHEMLGDPASGLDPTLGPAATWALLARLSAPPRGRVVVASEAMRALAASHLTGGASGAERNLHCLPHGHDLSAFLALPDAGAASAAPPPRSGGGAKSRSPGSAATSRRLVVIASIIPRKGLDWLIDLVADHLTPAARGTNAAGAVPPFTIEVIGAAHDKGYLKQLQARAKARGVSARFVWSGYCADLPARLVGARAVLHPSRNDPSPVGLILAMAAAKPIVATRCGGPEQMLTDGVSGRLVDREDAAGFAAAMRALLTDPTHGASWGAAARRQAVATYGLEGYLDRFEALCGELVGGGEAAGDRETCAADDGGLFAAILEACHRHVGAAGVTELKHLTPRQKKALTGIVHGAKLLKKTLPAGLYDRLAGLW
ncbi:MAG: glycosyltransferase family 4 protein [Planctomycetota bacterium]